MLVSANAGASLRSEVDQGRAPRPEYLQLERRHGVELLDLSRVRRGGGGRSPLRSLHHLVAALPRLRELEVVLCDGEHLGIPLALAMRGRRAALPLVVIGHHLTTPAKTAAFRLLRAHGAMTRIVVHSQSQSDTARERLGIPAGTLRVIPYGVDLDFWHPLRAAADQLTGPEDLGRPLIVAPGREHRDLATLAAAFGGRDITVAVTAFSTHSARARGRHPDAWPPNISAGAVDIRALRGLYASAAVVVVPLLPATFPAGITTVLEAMAMGKALVVSATPGLEGVIDHGRTGMLVTPGDAGELSATVDSLLADPARRSELGRAARLEAETRFGLDRFVESLAFELREAAAGGRGRR